MKPTLLVFAAGMGSRYGGLKQMDSMGPSGETLIDYSIYDAVRAGFGKIVYIVRSYFHEEMERSVRAKYSALACPDGEKVEFRFVDQELDMLPEGFSVPQGREKPWGTAHAILVARDVINEPFVTINGDDYYGRETFGIAAEWCRAHEDTAGEYAVLGFTLDNTLTDAGGVNRGICFYDDDRNLKSMVQHLHITKDGDGTVRGANAITGEEAVLNASALCSMNMFCLTPDYFERTEEVFREFLQDDGRLAGKEFDPPFVFDCIIRNGEGSCEVLSTPSRWFGVTYREDKPEVVARFMELHAQGLYPTPLWRQFDLEFGTGGLRAVMGPGADRMNDMTVAMATQGLANYILRTKGQAGSSVVISFDGRNHSKEFADITARVLSSNGIDVHIFDSLRPTPEMSYAIRLKNATAGIMITASHNPPEYNGYKVSWSDGGQITSPVDKEIVAEVGRMQSASEVRLEPLPGTSAGKITVMGEDEDECYLRDILSLTLSPDSVRRHSDLGIVYTPLHGCGVRLVPECLRRLGFNNVHHVPEQDITDGNFPTVSSPNPEEAPAWEMALKVAEKTGADLVLATDPDADRMGAAVRDDQGRIVRLTGNQTAALLTWYILTRRKELGTLHEGCYVVKTIVTTRLIDDIAEDFGVTCHNVLTGWKYLAEQVNIHGNDGEFVCGGEESCGFNAGEFVRDKDAQLACSLMAELAAWAADRGSSIYGILQDLYGKYGFWEETRFSMTRKGKEGLAEIRRIMEDYRQNPPRELAGSPTARVIDYLKPEKTGLPAADVLQFISEGGDIVSMRPSGTEPKIRFYFSTKGSAAQARTAALRKQFGI